ncbi:hypothetical protein F3F61_12495 [Bacteroides ovatus]|nr:hypothetical protein F3F61_12495 [Bacteroides ovatus]
MSLYRVTTYLFFFIILQTKNRKIGIKMKLRYYQIAIRYKNKSKRIRDASIYTSKKYRSSFYS